MLFLQEETKDKNQAPDGYYVPRILFVGKYLYTVVWNFLLIGYLLDHNFLYIL